MIYIIPNLTGCFKSLKKHQNNYSIITYSASKIINSYFCKYLPRYIYLLNASSIWVKYMISLKSVEFGEMNANPKAGRNRSVI